MVPTETSANRQCLPRKETRSPSGRYVHRAASSQMYCRPGETEGLKKTRATTSQASWAADNRLSGACAHSRVHSTGASRNSTKYSSHDAAPADKDGFVVRTLNPKVADSTLMASMSFWNVNVDGTLHIVWSTDYVGWTVRLSGSGPELRGSAHYFTDTDPFPPTSRDIAVVAQTSRL